MTDEISQLRAEIADLKRHVLELKEAVQPRVMVSAVNGASVSSVSLGRPDGLTPCDPWGGLRHAYTPALDAWKE